MRSCRPYILTNPNLRNKKRNNSVYRSLYPPLLVKDTTPKPLRGKPPNLCIIRESFDLTVKK